MTDAMENAARAFDSSMGRAPARAAKQEEASGGPEPIFENLGEHLDTSLENAGGDNLPSPDKSKREKVALQPDPKDEDDEDVDGDAGDEDEDEEDVDGDAGDEDEDDELTDEEKAALEEDEDADPELNKEFTVMVDGVEKTVKLKEALNGYIRQDTFYQRLNQLAEVKETLVTEGQQLVKDRQTYVDKLSEAEQILSEMMPAEPDWDAEFAKDGVRANALRKQYDAFKGKVTEIKGKREVAQKEANDAYIRDTTTFAQNEYPKFVKAAGWKGKEDQVRDTKSMRRTGLALGFSEEELAQVYDSRLLTALLKASKYDRMMAARPKPVQKKVNGKQQVSLGAGRTVSRTAPKGVNAAQSRLSKTGSLDDAATVFDQILSSSRKKGRRNG